MIYNPYAGRIRRRRRLVDRSMSIMREAGHHVKAISTTGPGSASEIAKCCLDRGADLILVAGGDGTINEVVNGMVFSMVPLGILPGGTANVLANETGIGGHMTRAALQLSDLIPERVSLGSHKDGPEYPARYFLLMCGIGFDAHIVYHLSASLKAALGKFSYWIGGFSRLGRPLPAFEVVADGQRFEATFALASRVRNYGGDIEIAPTITLLEDQFELVLFAARNSLAFLPYMAGILRHRLEGMSGVTIVRCQSIRVQPENRRIYTQIDGEYAGPLPTRLDIVPRCLTLLLPQKYRTLRKAPTMQQEWTTSLTR